MNVWEKEEKDKEAKAKRCAVKLKQPGTGNFFIDNFNIIVFLTIFLFLAVAGFFVARKLLNDKKKQDKKKQENK